jgi:hypothetical protein
VFARNFWLEHFPDDFWVDLRRPLDGENWYPAELDGRWMGPGPVSTLRFPPIPAANFRIELEVVGAVHPSQLDGVSITIAHRTQKLVAVNESETDFPIVLYADFSMTNLPMADEFTVEVRVAETDSPADYGSDDQRMLGLRLRNIRLLKFELAG